MKLIIGLGNPGSKYRWTRHNIGFLMIERLGERRGWTEGLYQEKYKAIVGGGQVAKRQIMHVKPQTFMNRSGISISKLVDFYKLDPEFDVLVVHDDIDLPFGKTKLKFGGSHGGHNGIRDTILRLGHERFRRLKLGVGRPEDNRHSVVDYVLGNFDEEQRHYRWEHEKEIADKVGQWLKNVG